MKIVKYILLSSLLMSSACGGNFGAHPMTAAAFPMAQHETGEFNPADTDKNTAGTWIIGTLAVASAVATAILIPVYLSK